MGESVKYCRTWTQTTRSSSYTTAVPPTLARRRAHDKKYGAQTTGREGRQMFLGDFKNLLLQLIMKFNRLKEFFLEKNYFLIAAKWV